MKIYPYQFKNYTKHSFGKKSEQDLFNGFSIQKNVIECAMNELGKINFDENDIKKVSDLGAKVIFKNGNSAVNFAKEKNIEIIFGKVERNDIHAQWSKAQNKIIINKKYQNSDKISEILAIAASILHELAHATDDDSISSIQEEIDCLAMNSLAYNAFSKKYKNVFCGGVSKIIKDGVELYANLFFFDNKNNLIKRISEKYGNLALSSPFHPQSKLSKEVKDYYLKNTPTL